jgi:O-antigen ligase
MRNGLLIRVRNIGNHRGLTIILGCVLVGLMLARLTIVSPSAAIAVLLAGIAVVFAVLVRRVEYLLVAWFVLTTFVWVIMTRFMPEYYSIVGRGIFWGLLGCAIMAWALDNTLNGLRFVPFDNGALKAATFGFVLWGVMSLYTSQEAFVSIKKLSHIVIALIASYAVYDLFSRDQDNIKKVLRSVSVIVVAVALVAVASAFHGLATGTPIYKELSLWFRNPNSLGTLLFMITPMVVSAGFDFVYNRRVRILLTAVPLLGLFFSFHRTSWLATLVSIAFILARIRRMKAAISAAMVAGLFAAGLLFPVAGGDVYEFITGEHYTGRIEIWKASWRVASENPVFGTGPGTSVRNVSQYVDTPWLKNEDTHSAYLKNAVEMGYMSVIMMLACYVVFFYYSIRIERNLKSEYLKAVTRGAIATMLGLLVHGIFECGFFMTPFDASGFNVIWPYIMMVTPFAAKKLEERTETG